MKIIECPRDAMQGLQGFVPTKEKASYLNQLLNVGFDTIDFGSFVSPKAIPQLRDTAEVLDLLDLEDTDTSLLAIVANVRGAEQAARFNQISFLGFPLSLSETFQQRNTNKSIREAFQTVSAIQEICSRSGQMLVVYLSMGFGNPYGDPYNPGYISEFIAKLEQVDVRIISLADTMGRASAENIGAIYTSALRDFKNIEIGVHLHSNPKSAPQKISAAFDAGCERIDGAILGIGGCPMADDTLVGNIATEAIIHEVTEKNIDLNIDMEAWQQSKAMAVNLFGKYH